MQSDLSKRRWYDKQPLYAHSVRILEHSPPIFQTLIADGINLIAEREFNIEELLGSVKSLGPEKVMALHQSKGMRRILDQNKTMHRTLNYLYILSEKNREFMAVKIHQLHTHLVDYVNTCKKIAYPLNTDDLERITQVFVQRGHAETQRFIDQLKVKLYSDIHHAVTLKPDAKMDNDRSMRLQPGHQLGHESKTS